MPIWSNIVSGVQNYVGQFQPQNTITVTNPQSGGSGSSGDQGFSSADDGFSSAGVPVSGGGSGSSSSSSSGSSSGGSSYSGGSNIIEQAAIETGYIEPSNLLDRNTVVIDGQGYSVAPEHQAEFIATSGQRYSSSTGVPSSSIDYQSGGNLLTDTGLGFSGVSQPSELVPSDITQTYIPGIDYTLQQMAQKTQSTQIPELFQVEYDIDPERQSTLLDTIPTVMGGVLRRGGQGLTYGAGSVLDFTGDILGQGADIIFTPEQTAIKEAAKLTDPKLQQLAQEQFDDFSTSTTPFGLQGADRYYLLGRIKGLVKRQERINERTGQDVSANIDTTRKELNAAIEQNNILIGDDIKTEIDPDTGEEALYYIGDKWSQVDKLNKKITSLESELEKQQNKLPEYENLPKTDVVRRAAGGVSDVLTTTISGIGQGLQAVSPYADITKLSTLSGNDLVTAGKTIVTAPAYYGAGIGEEISGPSGGVKDFLDENIGTNVVSEFIYKAGRETPAEVKKMGLIFSKDAWQEQPQEFYEGLVNVGFLARPTYKFANSGTQAVIRWKTIKDIGKMEGKVIGDDLVRFETQFGKKGVAGEVGDVIVQQEIDTLKNTIRSRTYQFVREKGKTVKKLVDETAETALKQSDDVMIAEIKKQLQNKPSKIKLDDKRLIRHLVDEPGFGGVIKTRLRRKARVTVGQQSKVGVKKGTTTTLSKIGKQKAKFAQPVESYSKLPVDITSAEANAIIGFGGDSFGISTQNPMRRLIQKISLQSTTAQEGALYRKIIGVKSRTEQALKLGDKTDTTKKWVKLIKNEAGEVVGVKTYIKPRPKVTEKITQTTDINVGGMIGDGRLADIVTDLRTVSGGPMKYQYSPLEVAKGTIKSVGRGSGPWGKKGQRLQLSYADKADDVALGINKADEVIDLIPDVNVNPLQSTLLGPTQKTVTSKYVLTEIKTPSSELTNMALKNMNKGSKLYLDSTKIQLPSFQNKIKALGTYNTIENVQGKELQQEQLLQQKVLQQKVLQQQLLQQQIIQQQNMIVQQGVLQKQQRLSQRKTQKTPLIQPRVPKLTPVIGPIIRTPVRPAKPKKPKRPKFPLVFKMDNKDIFTERKKNNKKAFSSRYSASLSGLLKGSKKKPKIITGVEMRGSKKDFSKEIRKLTGL